MSKTATQLNSSRPLTPVGTEIIAADAGAGTGGATSGQTGGVTTQAIANLFKGTRGTAIASASTVDLGAATGTNVHVTGSTGPITSFGTAAAGVEREVIFDSTPTITYNATSLILPTSANIAVAAGDTARFVSEGSGNWRCIKYQRFSGQPLVAGGMTNPMTTSQDIIVGGSSGTPGRLAVGSAGQALVVNGSGNLAYAGGEGIAEPVNALTNSSGTVAINCASGDYFTLSLTANVTSITFSNLPASGKAQTIMVEIKQDATGSRTAAWPSSFKWSGSAPALSTAANSVDVLAITTFDQGTTWRATLAKGFA